MRVRRIDIVYIHVLDIKAEMLLTTLVLTLTTTDDVRGALTPAYLDLQCSSYEDCGVISLDTEMDYEIKCTITGPCLNETLSQLPDNITDLTLTVDKFPRNGVSFSSFDSLKRLEIRWIYGNHALVHVELNWLTDNRLFTGLQFPTHLKISIPITTMNSALFIDLKNLTELDLTDIGHFSTKKFAKLYRGSKLEDKPIEPLILKRMSGVFTAGDRLFMLKKLFPLFNGSNITMLDISDNRELYLYPGLTQYLPHLKYISLHGNAIRYKEDTSKATCTILELLNHKNLEIVDVSSLGQMGDELDYYGMQFLNETMECLSRS